MAAVDVLLSMSRRARGAEARPACKPTLQSSAGSSYAPIGGLKRLVSVPGTLKERRQLQKGHDLGASSSLILSSWRLAGRRHLETGAYGQNFQEPLSGCTLTLSTLAR